MAEGNEIKIDCHGGTALGFVLKKYKVIILATDRKLVRQVSVDQGGGRKSLKMIPVKKPIRKIKVLHKKIACAHVGLRVGAPGYGTLNWINYVKRQTKEGSTFDQSYQCFKDYHETCFQIKESVEMLLACWEKEDEPKLVYCNNSGFLETPVYAIGTGRYAALGKMVNQGIQDGTLDEEAAVSLAHEAIYRASLSHKTTTGCGSEVLVLRFGKEVIAEHIECMSQEELEKKFGPKEGEVILPTKEDYTRWGMDSESIN